jgi:spore coat polysaccharide biosynthesis protein SpsF (cytidylyltransferase family)
LDVEACSFKTLKKAWKEAKEPQHREHAMPYFYEGVELTPLNRTLETGFSPRGYEIALLHHITDFGDYRWTVDTPEDLEFMRQVYSRFNGRDDFSWKEVLDLVHDEPELMKINAGVEHKTLKDIDKRALKR